MGQEASVPQRIGDELSSSTSASTKAANAIRGANDAAAAAVAAANNAAASVFVGQSSSPSSSQPQSQQQYAVSNNINSNGGPTAATATGTSSTTTSSSSSIMSRSGITSMIQSAKRLSVRTNNTSGGGGGGGESSSSTDVNHNNNNVNMVSMNGGTAPHNSPLHHQHKYYNTTTTTNNNDSIHHGELSPKSLAIMMQQQQQRQLAGLGKLKKKYNKNLSVPNQNHSHPLQQQQQQQQQQVGKQQQFMQQQYYQQQQQQQQQSEHTPPISSAQSTPYHTPQGSMNSLHNGMYTTQNTNTTAVAATLGAGGGDGSSISASDAQTVHTTNVTNTTTKATQHHQQQHHHHVVQGMSSLSLNSNSNHGTGKPTTSTTSASSSTTTTAAGSTTTTNMKLNKGTTAPASPRALALNKMKDNDEDDWAKAWAEDSGSDDDDDEDEEEEEEEGGDGGGGSSDKVSSSSAGGVSQLPPSMPVLAGQGTAMGQQQQQQQYQLQQQHHQQNQQQPQQQYIIQQQQSRPPPFVTPGQPQPKELLLPTDRVVQQQLFTSPPPPSQQQHHQHQQQQQVQYPPQQQQQHLQHQHHLPQHQQQQQAIMGDEDAKLLMEADEALLKDGGSWDPYCADESVEEKPCVEMFDPALRVLGRGSFGRVVLVQKQYGQGKGSLFAMKILRKSHLVRRRQIERTKTERKVLARLDHPFLMKLYYAFQTTEKLFLVLDYCPGGELFFHLSRYRRFQEPVARFYAAELMLAIGHLHKHGVIYRDLKPENVLLDAYGHVKLGDFGLAKDGIRHPTQGAKSTCGTPEYMAPEVLNQQGHGFCVDYWGLGMILFEMMTGLPPWYTTDRAKLFRRLRSAPLIFPNEISFSPNCKTCIAGLLERDPRLRIGVLGLRSAMRHEFFHRKINFEALRARQISAPIRPCEGWRQFQSRSNSVESESKGWHSANPSLDSAAMGNITAEALDVATANFDDSFRRMPIETEDYEKQQQAQGQAPISEKDLNAQTFRGFTFDGHVMPGDVPGDNGQPRQGPPPTGRRQNPPNDLRGELT